MPVCSANWRRVSSAARRCPAMNSPREFSWSPSLGCRSRAMPTVCLQLQARASACKRIQGSPGAPPATTPGSTRTSPPRLPTCSPAAAAWRTRMVTDTSPTTDPTRHQPELKRVMGPKLLLLFIVGDILGTGIYAVTGTAAKQVGGVVWLPFLLAFVVATITAFSYLELVTKYPQAAG